MNVLEEELDAPPPSPQVMPGPLGEPGIPDKPYYKYLFTEFHSKTITPKQYTTLVKANIEVLKKFCEKRIKLEEDREEKSSLMEKQLPEYRKRFLAIFSDKEVSITSLNIKSLLCVALFTEIMLVKNEFAAILHKAQEPGGLSPYPLRWYTGRAMEERHFYVDMYEILNRLVDLSKVKDISYYRHILTGDDRYGRLIIDDDGKMPDLKGSTVIASILGDLSLEDMNVSLANNIHLVGITDDVVIADGYCHTPLSFLFHDLFHISAYSDLDATGIVRDNIWHFLNTSYEYRMLNGDGSGETPGDQKYMCNLWIFLIQHEHNLYLGAKFPGKLYRHRGTNPLKITYETESPLDSLYQLKSSEYTESGIAIDKAVAKYFLAGAIHLNIKEIIGYFDTLEIAYYTHLSKTSKTGKNLYNILNATNEHKMLLELSTSLALKTTYPRAEGQEPFFYRLLPDYLKIKVPFTSLGKDGFIPFFESVKKFYEDAWVVFKGTWNAFIKNNHEDIEYSPPNFQKYPREDYNLPPENLNKLRLAASGVITSVGERNRASKRAKVNASNAGGGGRHRHRPRRKTRKRAKVTQRPA